MQQLRACLARVAALVRSVGRNDSPPHDRAIDADAHAAPADSSVFDELTHEQIDGRIQVTTDHLHRLGAFEETASIPMRRLTDEQLDERINQVEEELRRLGAAVPADVGDEGYISPAEKQAVLRQLDVLDYLINNPDASMSPAASLEAIAAEDRHQRQMLAPQHAPPRSRPRRQPTRATAPAGSGSGTHAPAPGRPNVPDARGGGTKSSAPEAEPEATPSEPEASSRSNQGSTGDPGQDGR